MNFSPFGNHFPPPLPPIHQLTAKFPHDPPSTTANSMPPPPPPPPPLVTTAIVTSSDSSSHHQTSPATSTSNVIKYPRSGSMSAPPPPGQALVNIGVATLSAKYIPTSTAGLEGVPIRHVTYTQGGNILIPPMATMKDDDKDGKERKGGAWPEFTAPAASTSVNEYLSRFPPPSTIPLSLHQFLKYSAESMKKAEGQLIRVNSYAPPPGVEPLKPIKAKKKKKNTVAAKKRALANPGEIQITTALDGSTLYCCPQCHVAYTDKDQLEQHMLGHRLERPFVCDLCGTGLKRKEHLDRHKQEHSGERPYVCGVCLKGFKRNEHLARHGVIHSGDKSHVCTECGKGFSRRDHLAKHAHTHLAKRVKAEFSQGHHRRLLL